MSFNGELGCYIDPLDQRSHCALNHVTTQVSTVIGAAFNLTEADGSTSLTEADGATVLTGIRITPA